MIRAIKLKIFGRYKIRGTKVIANPQNTDKPDSFYLSCYHSEEIVCRDCEVVFIHSASEKQDYFEVQKGNIYKQFVRCEKCDAIKYPERYKTHNKIKNENATKTGADAARTRRPF